MNKKLEVGMLVVCVNVLNPDYTFLIGQVGTIRHQVSPLFAMLYNAEWVVEFPDTAGRICPNCHKSHGSEWPMASSELRPLEDPDSEADRITEQSLEEVTEELHEFAAKEPGGW